MKVNFAGTDLCTGVGKSSPGEFSLDGKRKTQVTEPLRAAQVIARDRNNRQTQIDFVLAREHGTIQEAEFFALTHMDSLPGSGLLTLVADDGSHTNTKSTYIANAVLTNCKVSYKGQLSFTTYSFVGGAVAKTKPT